jgi:hypothetical protein
MAESLDSDLDVWDEVSSFFSSGIPLESEPKNFVFAKNF